MEKVKQRTVHSVSATTAENSLHELWLTMPTNITHSFADDLIREFDNRRSQLQSEMIQFQVLKSN
jgi:hypothetical protein